MTLSRQFFYFYKEIWPPLKTLIKTIEVFTVWFVHRYKILQKFLD